jgi:hypothetical protein
MNKHQETVLANNILEFLIDPTKFPVTQRVYFRPEEILRNESYEDAKADSYKAYKDQKKNSDFYPTKNRPSREAFIMDSKMDRKTMIASLDVLAQHFYDENDPMAKDLRTIAKVVHDASDEEYNSRLASSIEAKGKAETIPCPKCGTKILKQTGYCLKCKKKTLGEAEASTELWTKEAADAVQDALVSDVVGAVETPAPEEKKDEQKEPVPAPKEEKESFMTPTSPEPGQRFQRPSYEPGGKKFKSLYNEFRPETQKLIDRTKELADFFKKADEEVPAPEKEPMPKKEDEKEAKKAADLPVPEKKEEKAPAVVPPVEEKKASVEEKKAAAPVEEKKATEPKKIVDTSILAYDGIEMEAGMQEAGDLSAEEQSRLNQLFQ